MKHLKLSTCLVVVCLAITGLAVFAASAPPEDSDELKFLRDSNVKLSQRYFAGALKCHQLEQERDSAIDELEQARAACTAGQVHGRVVDLPEDADNLHTILFLQPDFAKRPNELRAKQLFDSQPWCLDLRSRTHWHVWTIDLPEAKPYWKFVTKTPCLMILDCAGEAGRVLYSEANPDLAKKPDGLLHQINVTRKRQKHGNQQPFNCPDGVCPIPKKEEAAQPINPAPENVVAPAKEEAKEEIKAPVPPADKNIPVALALAIAAVVAVGSFVIFKMFVDAQAIARATHSGGD